MLTNQQKHIAHLEARIERLEFLCLQLMVHQPDMMLVDQVRQTHYADGASEYDQHIDRVDRAIEKLAIVLSEDA